MGGEQQLIGPDLAKGIPATDVRDGAMRTGHFNNENVLVARVNGAPFAIAATCSHYGGPLGDGLLVGDTVRCPWHHACFSLRTGASLRAPALNDVARYTVEERNGVLRVTGKEDPGFALRDSKLAAKLSGPNRVVIVGGGAAGNSAAEELRRSGFNGAIVMVESDSGAPCDRPNLSKDYLAGNAPEDWIPLHPPEYYAEHKITIRHGHAVSSIDTEARAVLLDDGTRIEYSALILATGAEPVHLPDAPGALYLRTLADSRAIIAAAGKAKKAVVIGASFIGLEVAASLRARNLEVHVVAPETRPLERVLGARMGDFIKALHEEHGVKFHLGTKPSKIEKTRVTLENGEHLDADMVVIGVGVRPRSALAEHAHMALDKGVVVDEYLETSAAGVFACGDIARYPDQRSGQRIRVEHWVHAQRMGQAAARNALGAREKFTAVPFFWSQHYDVAINYVGHAEEFDEPKVDGDPASKDCAVRYEHGGTLMALATIFRDDLSLETEVAMERERAAAD